MFEASTKIEIVNVFNTLDTFNSAYVVTHSGVFHADEVLAVAILSLVYDKIYLMRTRNKELIEKYKKDKNIILLDIGMEYNPEYNNFDHHQNRNDDVATSGLVWQHYGHKIVNNNENYKLVYEELIKDVDLWDNNKITNIPALSQVVRNLNPSWRQEGIEYENRQFIKAVNIAREILLSTLERVNSKEEVKNIVENSKIIDDNILVLERFVPWQEYVVENCKYVNIKFVIYQNKDKKYNAQAVPVSLNSRENKCLFPAEWAGLEGNKLEEVTGVKGSIFCHRGRFLVVAENLDSVLKLVKLALQS